MGSGRALAFQLGQVSPARLPEPLSSFRPSCVLGRGGQAAAVGLISSGNQAKNTREMLWEMLHIVGPKQLVFSLSLSYAHPWRLVLNVGTCWLFLILYIPFTVMYGLQVCLWKTTPLQILTPNFSFLFGDRRTSKSTGACCGENKSAIGVRRVDTEAIKSLSFNENYTLSHVLLVVEYSLI